MTGTRGRGMSSNGRYSKYRDNSTNGIDYDRTGWPTGIDGRTVLMELLDSIDYVMFDCDGTCWVDYEPVPNGPEAVKLLRKIGKKVRFVTNNGMVDREFIRKRLSDMGYEATIDEVFTTSYSAAVYFQKKGYGKNGGNEKKVFVIGGEGICDELKKVNIESEGRGPDNFTDNWAFGGCPWTPDPRVRAVVISLDFRISYPKIVKACSYLNQSENEFCVTDMDCSYPSKKPGIKFPGSGSLVKAIEVVVNRKPNSFLGKPHKLFWECITTDNPKLTPDRALMVGDLIHSDMEFGNRHGCKTMLVLSGISTIDDVEQEFKKGNNTKVPGYYIQSIGHIYTLYTQGSQSASASGSDSGAKKSRSGSASRPPSNIAKKSSNAAK